MGNTRVMFGDNDGDGIPEAPQEDHYYPFGLKLADGGIQAAAPAVHLYNGKELQDELGLGWYDYGARMYAPTTGRWNGVDALADVATDRTPCHFVSNSPINKVDPTGLTDYTFNRRTGEINQVGEANEDPDRILRTDRRGEIKYRRNGEARVAIGGIEKGILRDGQNFRTDDQPIDVGGEGQSSVSGVEDFVTQFAELVGVEIAGVYLSEEDAADANISRIIIDEYEGNEAKKSRLDLLGLNRLPSGEQPDGYPQTKGYYPITHFHTHPTNVGASRLDIERPSGTTGSGGDLAARDRSKNLYYHFLILTRTASSPSRVMRIDYTNW